MLGLAVLSGAIATLWAFGAIRYDGPLSLKGNTLLASFWLTTLIVLLPVLDGVGATTAAWAAALLVVLVPWLMIRASHDRDWQALWAVTGSITVDGDRYVIEGFRNFEHREDGTALERWETRTVLLSNLRGVDLILDRLGGNLLSHPLLSFDFGPDGRVVLSIETRREVGESFSKIGGLYKMYELQYLFGSERDFIRLRTEVYGNPVFLYRSRLSPDLAKRHFLDSVAAANAPRDTPRFYNILSANCTTSLRAQTDPSNRLPFDLRFLINGQFDKMLYERGALDSAGLPLDELRDRAFLNDRVATVDANDDFSEKIREGVPGF